MTALIIDDERRARNVLRILIEENCSKITKILEAKDLISGIEMIKAETPSIVFLDIEMPEYSGLEILNFIEKEVFNFEIIFTTAYSEYAIEAFQLSAIDYLLKPVRSEQVREAVDRAIKFIGKTQTNLKIEALKKQFETASFNKIALPVADGIMFLPIDELITLKADGMYTLIATVNDGELLISKPLKFFVEALHSKNVFFRPHRSFLINISYIKAFKRNDGGYIIMSNGDNVSLSKDKREDFLAIVGNL